MNNAGKISACIIVKNAQKTLKECLESVRDFDEIILLDNGSTDRTLQIAQEFNATYKNLRVKQSEFIGFGALKNLCVSFAKNEWILSLDSDEVLESSALHEINALNLEPNQIYALPRKNLYNGEWIKACGWYPDFVWRIFNKNFTRFNDNAVHESVMIPTNAQKIHLKGAIKHYAFANIDSIIAKMNRYTSQSAQEKLKNGKKTSFFSAFARLHFVFFKDYFLRKGFLYGYKGFIVALLNALGAFFRYAKLYELSKDKKEPKVIAFDRRLGVGDIISSIPAFYFTKQLYPQATFILITNKIGASLCRNFDFIDKFIIEGVDFETKDFAKVVDENEVEALLLGHRSSANIKLAKQSKCPKIITWRHLHSIFSQRFIHPKHIKRSQRLEILRCLDLVRMINAPKYDKNIDKFELKSLPIQIQTDRKNKIFVDEFLSDAKKYEKIIAISPFGISSAKYNLAIDDWISLVKNLAKKFDKALFVFMNFRGSDYEFEPFIEENIKVFVNNDDLLNLVELTSRVNLCISLSTGNIHIADNLGIDTLGFFAYTDEFLFPCGNYGGNFEVLYLPKDWKKDYEFYKNAFYQKAQKCVEKTLLGHKNKKEK